MDIKTLKSDLEEAIQCAKDASGCDFGDDYVQVWGRITDGIVQALNSFLEVCEIDDNKLPKEKEDLELFCKAKYRIARGLRRQEKYDESINILDGLLANECTLYTLKENGKSGDVYKALAEAYRCKRIPDKAAEYFQLTAEATEALDEKSKAFAQAGYRWKEAGQLEKSVNCFLAEAECYPKVSKSRARALTLAASRQADLGQAEAALQTFNMAFTASGDDQAERSLVQRTKDKYFTRGGSGLRNDP